jgi:uncharacterized protein (TIGR03083 family)
VDHDTYLEHLRRESEAFLAAAAVDLARPVPACPDWTVADLVWHLGEVHHFWATVAAEGSTDRAAAKAVAEPDRPAEEDLLAFARAEADRLVDVLAGLDPWAPRWNWSSGPQTAAFVARRMAHETAVHRVDAEQAAGEAAPVDARLAADGVDELLTVFLPASGDYRGPAGFVGVAETDTGRAWAVRLDPPEAEVVSPMKMPKRPGELEQIHVPASQLLLVLWGRRDAPGKRPLLTALRDHVDLE